MIEVLRICLINFSMKKEEITFFEAEGRIISDQSESFHEFIPIFMTLA